MAKKTPIDPRSLQKNDDAPQQEVAAPSVGAEDGPVMPIAQHLLELRRRLTYCLVALVLGFGTCYFFSERIFQFLLQPLAQALPQGDQRVIYTGLPEAFLTYLKVSLYGAFFLCFPCVVWHIWRFVAPGLYTREKKHWLPVMCLAPILFYTGAAFAFYGVIPRAWAFFVSFQASANQGLPIQLEARVSEYLTMTMSMSLAFACCFQLPLVLWTLGHFGVITKQQLQRGRKYSFVGILILAAALTPPDVFSMLALALPIYGLYEVSIFVMKSGKK